MPRHPACCLASAITSICIAASSPVFASCLPKSGGLRATSSLFNSPSPHYRAVGESPHRMPGHSRPTGQVQSTHQKTTRLTLTKRPGHAHTMGQGKHTPRAASLTSSGCTDAGSARQGGVQQPRGHRSFAHTSTHRTRSHKGDTVGTSAGHTLALLASDGQARQTNNLGAQVQAT